MRPIVKNITINKELDPKKNTIFISAGDSEVFATYSKKNLIKKFNIVIFYYGNNRMKEIFLRDGVNIFLVGNGSKFNALKYIYDNKYLEKADGYIWVCDDDIVVSDFKRIDELYESMSLYRASLASPSHSVRGKISFAHMKRSPFTSGVRKSNFVEMTCPLFSVRYLKDFLDEYDYSLAGWGVDWWYSNFFKSKELGILIFDYISIFNPYARANGEREIDRYLPSVQRRLQWEVKRGMLGINEYSIATNELDLGFGSRLLNFYYFLSSEALKCGLYFMSKFFNRVFGKGVGD